MRCRRPQLPSEPLEVRVESLSHDGRGIAHVEGKTLFISGGLPGEQVRVRYTDRHSRYDEADTIEVLEASAERVIPRCPHFGVCGGCALQHLAPDAQIALKQHTLLEQLTHIGKVTPATVRAPLTGPLWGYRRKARMGVKYVIKKQSLLVSFRERCSGFLAQLQRCDVLHPAIGERLQALRSLVGGLTAFDSIAQIEVAVGESESGDQPALVFRNLVALDAADTEALRAFGQQQQLRIYLQSGGPDTVSALWPPDAAPLHYQLGVGTLDLAFQPGDFTQVNVEMNRRMIAAALELLALQPTDRVLELFCGLGNFTLPMATQAAQVTAVEGDAGLVARAQANAQRHGLNNINYTVANLMQEPLNAPWLSGDYNKLLLDPPRSGAAEIIRQLDLRRIERLLYVSCNPATLARDAGALVQQQGFQLATAGVMDMFPHTAHVESIALFTRRVKA